MVMFYLSLFAAVIASKCENDYLLTPSSYQGDVYSSSTTYQVSNVLDGKYNTYWMSNSAYEYLYFWFPEEATVEWIYIQRYYDDATWVEVFDGTTQFEDTYFGDSSELYSSMTLKYDNVYTDYFRFRFYYSGASYVRISRIDVYGCYNTSAPTAYPTTVEPTAVPSLFPTISPTLPPVTNLPSKTPSTSPSSAPSVSPSVANPIPYPSAAPTVSPTEAPSIKTVSPSKSPTASPTSVMTYMPSVVPSPSPSVYPTTVVPTLWPSTVPSFSPTETPTSVQADSGFEVKIGVVEFFLILIVLLCGVVLFLLLRYRKVLQVNRTMHPQQENKRIQLEILPNQENDRVHEGHVPQRSDGICMPEGNTRTGMRLDRIG